MKGPSSGLNLVKCTKTSGNATIGWETYGWYFLDADGVIFIDYLYHDDNAPSHTSNIAQAENLKGWLCGRRFESNAEVEWETEGY